MPHDSPMNSLAGPDRPPASDSDAMRPVPDPGITRRHASAPHLTADDKAGPEHDLSAASGPVESGYQNGGDDPDGAAEAVYGSTAHSPRRHRRTFSQKAAAAQDSRAALEVERRRLRTRGAILAGGLLVRLAKARPELKSELGPAIGAMCEHDREAIALFAKELVVT